MIKTLFSSRIRLLSVAILVIALILSGKLYLLQVVNGDLYSERADRQYVRPNQNTFDRGNILFQGKDGSLVGAATLKSGFTIAINPKIMTDSEVAYKQISKIYTLDADSFFAKASKKADPYEEIAKKVDPESAEKIEALDIAGVSLYKEKWRYYPGNTIGAHIIGFVGYKGDMLAGRYGLESYYEDVLARNNENSDINFFAEIFSDLNKTLLKGESREGNIVSSIEPTVEAFLEKELQEITDKWNPEISGGIIINPVNGEIYALAANPTFDPNFFNREKGTAVFANPLVESVYEMGSIIKPLTMAAGIDSGAVTAMTTYRDEGFLILNNYRIANHDGKGRGTVNMQEVLSQSLNTGAAFVQNKMGKEKFSEYMLAYGIGEETGIDLPNEALGIVDNLKSRRDIELATASYGQGIAMTPIATVRALSTLANGGILINPHIVKRIDYKLGYSKNISGSSEKRVLKKETADEISRMLVEVVDTALLEGKVKNKNFRIAAKTGTAQIANPAGGGYYEDRYLHSFFGYFPAYNPKFLIFLYTVYPKEVKYASETLTHPFIDITNFLINYYEVQPDR